MKLLETKFPVVMFSNAIGDHILSLPAMRALTFLFPGRIGLVGYHLAPIFFRDLRLNWIRLPGLKQNRDGAWCFDVDEVASCIGPCDLFLSLNPWHSESLGRLVEKLKPEMSVGFSPSFHIQVPRVAQKHSAELAFDIPLRLKPDLCFDDFTAPYVPSLKARKLARKVLGLFRPQYRVLSVHVDTRPEKMWPWERWVRVINAFLERQPSFVALFVGKRTPSFGKQKNRDRMFPCGLPLEAGLALVSESNLFVGVDSCMLHMADFSRISSVGLFGPTEVHEFGFRITPKFRHVPGDMNIMSIQEEEVLQALISLLDEGPSNRPERSDTSVPLKH